MMQQTLPETDTSTTVVYSQPLLSLPQRHPKDSAATQMGDSSLYRLLTPPTGIKQADSIAEVFGNNSALGVNLTLTSLPQRTVAADQQNNFLLDGILVLLFFSFTILVYRFRDYISTLFKAASVEGHINNLADEQSISFRLFITLSNLMGLVSILALGIKYYLVWSAEAGPNTIPANIDRYIIPIMIGIIVSIIIYRRILYFIIVQITLQGDLISKLSYFNRILFALLSVIVTPLALIIGFSGTESQSGVSTFGIIVLIMLILYYIFKSYTFFISRKVSSLQWFLYLCAIEIWPISFYILLALRNFKL